MRDIAMQLTRISLNKYTARLQCMEAIDIHDLYFETFSEPDSRERVRLAIGELNARCPCGEVHQIAMVRFDDPQPTSAV